MNKPSMTQPTRASLYSSKRAPDWWLPPKWLQFLIIAVLVLGVFFRFVNLDKKVYAVDETYTSLRISGYTEAELVQQVSQGEITGIKDLQKYQRTNSEKNVSDTVQSLAKEEPQLTPLYFVLARFWVQIFGNSVAVTRSFSAFVSLLALPCIYWLCLELFQSSLTGWIATLLIAISPFYVLYAQEARPYSLWSVTILLSSIALLRALRLNTVRSWCIYAATVALGLYSFLYFALVGFAHGIYVVAIKGFRGSKTIGAYIIASFAGLLAFLPWIMAMIANTSSLDQKTNWQSGKVPFSLLVQSWILNIARNFIDFDLRSESSKIYLILFGIAALSLIILILYSIYFLYRHTSKQICLFVLTLMAIPTLALVLPDVISGGIRSTHARYLFPFYLGSQLAIAYLFANKIYSNTKSRKQQNVWRLAMVTLFSFGVISCAVSSQAQGWWSKYTSSENLPIARIVNSSPAPLVIDAIDPNNISYTDIGNLICLSYLLNPDTKFEIVLEPNTPKISQDFSDVFILSFFKSASNLINRLENQQEQSVKLVFEKGETAVYKL